MNKPYRKYFLESTLKKDVLNQVVNYANNDAYLKGKNGNVLVEIRWINKPGEKFSRYDGGLVSSMISDWDKAESCETCGRNIVHAFYVYDIHEKKVKVYGADHVHIALGLPQPVSKPKLEKMQIELDKFNDSIEFEKKIFKNKESILFHSNFFDIRKSFKDRYKNIINLNKGLALFFNDKTKLGILYQGDIDDYSKELALEELHFIKYLLKHFGDLTEFLKSKSLNIDEFPTTKYGES